MPIIQVAQVQFKELVDPDEVQAVSFSPMNACARVIECGPVAAMIDDDDEAH